jgi:tripartite-type tricarboxylate transporter receptor subunit TctC
MKYGSLVRLYLLFAALLGFSCTNSGNYPDRPITLICPWSAGGGTDRVSRQIAFLLEQDLGIPVNVVNATGGGGVTGHTRGAVARPDGYTITMVTVELNMLHWLGLTNITYKSFHPIMMVNYDPAAILVRADSEWTVLEELQQSIQQKPGELKGSGTAFGGIWHVALAGYLNKVGLDPSDVNWIAMGGSAPSLQELIAGALDMVSCSLSEAQVLMQSGKVRALAVMSDSRLQAFPEVPTLKEMGINWQIGAYRGITTPVGVPEKRLEVLQQAVARVVNSTEYREFLTNTGAGYAALPSREFGIHMQRTDEEFGEILNGPAFANVERRYSAMFFPNILFGMLAFCLLGYFISGQYHSQEKSLNVSRIAALDICCLIAGSLLYVFVAEYTGFLIAASVLLLLLFWRLKVSFRVSIPLTALFVAVLYQLFAVYLRVPLPRAWIEW